MAGSTRYGLAMLSHVLLLASVTVSLHVHSEQILATEDGRQVLLKEDGSWSFVSKDRIVTNALGERFVLHPDGRWSNAPQESQGNSPAGKKPVNADRAKPPAPHIAESPSDVNPRLGRVTVFRTKVKGLKSTRTDSRTEFMVTLVNGGSTAIDLSNIDSRRFAVSTSRGQTLKVDEVIAEQPVLNAGEQLGIRVICQGSPRWMNANFIRLEIPAHSLGNPVAYVLDKPMDDVEVVKVSGF